MGTRGLLLLLLLFSSLACDVYCSSCSDCQNKIAPGKTICLAQDISGSGKSYIVVQGTDNWTFDGQGHVISGCGFYIYYNATGWTVKNVTVRGFTGRNAIYLSHAQGTLRNANICGNSGRGVTVDEGSRLEVHDSNIHGNGDVGFLVYGYHGYSYGYVYNSIICNNGNGSYEAGVLAAGSGSSSSTYNEGHVYLYSGTKVCGNNEADLLAYGATRYSPCDRGKGYVHCQSSNVAFSTTKAYDCGYIECSSHQSCSGFSCDLPCPTSSCTNECSQGDEEYQCSGDTVQKRVCGDYDGDGCYEWGDWTDVNSCNDYDGNYCSGNALEQRDYYCSNGACDYNVIGTVDCDDGDGWVETDTGWELRDCYCSLDHCDCNVLDSCTDECDVNDPGCGNYDTDPCLDLNEEDTNSNPGGPGDDEDSPPECSNGIDDDSDGLVDCQDPDCASVYFCSEVPKVPGYFLKAFCSVDGNTFVSQVFAYHNGSVIPLDNLSVLLTDVNRNKYPVTCSGTMPAVCQTSLPEGGYVFTAYWTDPLGEGHQDSCSGTVYIPAKAVPELWLVPLILIPVLLLKTGRTRNPP